MSLNVLEIVSGLSLLVLTSGLAGSAHDPRYQVFQPVSVSALVGESIILPCFFSNPREIEPFWELRVWWRLNNPDGDYIYRPNGEPTSLDYRERVSLLGDPWGRKTASIKITDLRERDSNRYFCRVQMMKNGRTETWQNTQGTELGVSASPQELQWRYHIFQPESISGVVGETVTLPCSFFIPQEIEPISNIRVSWRITDVNGDYIYRHSEKFTREDFRRRISLHGEPWGEKTASIRIRDLRESDSNRYFCQVQVTKSDGRREQVQGNEGTELRVSVSAWAREFEVVQPKSVSGVVRGSVTLPCSFSYPQRIEPVSDFRVSWRINSFHGEFIYNHSERFTRADFRGRISLVGDPGGQKTASIRIRFLRKSDNNKYFCQVQVKRSNGETEELQSIEGTELRVSAIQPNRHITILPWTMVLTSTAKIEGIARTVIPGINTEHTTRTAIPGINTEHTTRTATPRVNKEHSTKAVIPGGSMEKRTRGTWQFHKTDLILLATVSSVFKLGICLLVALCFHWHRNCKSCSSKLSDVHSPY